MGLFSFFNKKNKDLLPFSPSTPPDYNGIHPIPENLFIEQEQPQSKSKEENNKEIVTNNIDLLFQFLDRNHEAKGYDDALINPDISHMEQNLELLRNELERTIRKVKTFYEDFIAEIDFHIGSRSRSGMVDTVEELQMKKGIAESHIKKVLEIEDDARNKQGVGQGILLSYSRGFKNGLAAISHHSILKRTL